MESPDKDKIYVGNHNIDCTGAIREARYRHTKSGKFDGIHLLGSSGQKAFTLSVLDILKAAKVTSSEPDYHRSCAQFKYQNRKDRNIKEQSGKTQNQKPMKKQKTGFVPTYNRFDSFNMTNHPNW